MPPSNSPILWKPTLEQEIPQETFELGVKPQYVYVDIHGNEEREKQQIIPIQFLESEKLELKQLLYVTLNYSSDSEEWVVDCPELNIYGSGRDEAEAIKDFKIALEESYFSLKKDKDKLASQLEEEWKYLNRVIKEK